MGTEEVIMCNEESDERDCAIGTVKPMGRFHVVLKGSVEAFNELFKWPVRF